MHSYRAIGVVPEDMREGLNPFNDTLIFTNLPAGHAHPNSRNHLNVLLSDAIVALAYDKDKAELASVDADLSAGGSVVVMVTVPCRRVRGARRRR